MKYLTKEEFFGPSVNQVKTGMSWQAEKQRKHECLVFLRQINREIGGNSTQCLCIAISIFSLFTRKVPFSHFDHFMAAAMAHFIASKIEYAKPEINTYVEYLYQNAPNTNGRPQI